MNVMFWAMTASPETSRQNQCLNRTHESYGPPAYSQVINRKDKQGGRDKQGLRYF